ncbi:MAG TPA: efflux RND transporter periplasmic adaptor subunit, partial [Myxococcaceae bacterium]|nr:efflux RND transporter periplasmic adaptor subunit [Myxococcaceae bacterium]
TTVKISSNLSGDLIELHVKEGDRVARGQLLGQIDRKRFEASSKQALAAQSASRADAQVSQVEVQRATADFARIETLVGKGLASIAELDKARADRDAALARLASAKERHAQAAAAFEEAQTNLSKTTLVSPIDGTVIEKSREVGERVRGSDFSEDVVMTLAALNAMEVKIEVGEHEVVYLRPGQKAEISVDALEGQTFEGVVTEIAQKALVKNPGTEQEVTTFPIKVALASRPPGVMPGMSAEVRVVTETRHDTIVIPIQAVTVRSDKSLGDAPAIVETPTGLTAKKRTETLAKVVFVVDGAGKARPRRVRTGIASDTEMEVLDGLQEGEKIVEGPYRTLAKDLKDGDRVEEMKPKGRGGFSQGRS